MVKARRLRYTSFTSLCLVSHGAHAICGVIISLLLSLIRISGLSFAIGSTDTTSVDIDGLAATTKYYISVQAVADVADAAHTDGVWSDEFEFYTISAISDVHESGYVFFEDNLEWMNTEEFKGTWQATTSETR